MKRVAVVFNTRYGQTEKIANFIQRALEGNGIKVASLTLGEGRDISLKNFDGVLLGGPVYVGKFSHDLLDWTRRHVKDLNVRKVAFFSVSMNAADKRPEAQLMDMHLLSKFLQDTGLMPDWVASFAGSLNYTRYGFLTRWIMKRISGKAGGPTDTRRDHELTDWDEVAKFAEAVLTGDPSSRFASVNTLRGRDPTPVALAGA